MKIFSFVCVVLAMISFFASCGQKEVVQANLEDQLMQNVDLSCDKEKLKTVVIVSELAKFRSPKDEPISQIDEDKIHKLVEQLKEKEDFIALAKITLAFRRHTSGELECKDSEIIPAFEIAFWHCMKILAKDRSEENISRLKLLKEELRMDGGDAYNWSTVVDGIPQP